MTTAGELLARSRHRSGLSQAAVARAAGVAQPMVSTYERGHREPTLPTLARLVAASGHDLVVDAVPRVVTMGGFQPASLAVLAGWLVDATSDPARRRLVLEFLEEYRWERPGDRPRLLRSEPTPVGIGGWDALLAGVAEHLAFHDDAPVPDWVYADERFLPVAWFWDDRYPSVRQLALIHSPAALRRRNVFVARHDLERR